MIPFIRSADDDARSKKKGHGPQADGGGPRTTLVEHHKPHKLIQLLDFELPNEGQGRSGFLKWVEQVLQYSVNTWDQGFMDKLYACPDAAGVASELILAVLNTNLHVYQVSPALTIIEKTTCRTLASLFGFCGPHAGGISVQGGSAANTTSIVVARNNLFPDTKDEGNFVCGRRLVIFTSKHGHYSIEKAAQMLGFGSSAVWTVPTDSSGCMLPDGLSSIIDRAKTAGFTPFYVNATSGTTVLGSYDPLRPIAAICKDHSIWLHVDASWGGPAIFSAKHASKLDGCHLANSIAVNPHKMMGVPLTCSFLLSPDLRQFHAANTLPAPYLFHSASSSSPTLNPSEIYDLADLTLQCGRRGDSLKLALGWIFYGREGYEKQIDQAFSTAAYMASLVAKHPDLILVSENPPPCLQVCFYCAPAGVMSESRAENSEFTENIAKSLVPRGFMVDFAPGNKGAFLRVVVNRETREETVHGLLEAVVQVGKGLRDRI